MWAGSDPNNPEEGQPTATVPDDVGPVHTVAFDTGSTDLSVLPALTDATQLADTVGTVKVFRQGTQPVQNGDIVAWETDYKGDDSSIRVVPANVAAPTAPHEIAGVALHATTAEGDPVSVMTDGIATVKRDANAYPDPTLHTPVNGENIVLTEGYYNYVDTGGDPANYGNSESFVTIFDAGEGGTWTVVSGGPFVFEATSNHQYDRLRVMYSNFPTGPWVTMAEPWMANVDSVTNDIISQTGGHVYPKDLATATANGYTLSYTIPGRYARFEFSSDGSVNERGWSEVLISSTYTAPGAVAGEQLFAKTGQENIATSNSSAGTLPLGRAAANGPSGADRARVWVGRA